VTDRLVTPSTYRSGRDMFAFLGRRPCVLYERRKKGLKGGAEEKVRTSDLLTLGENLDDSIPGGLGGEKACPLRPRSRKLNGAQAPRESNLVMGIIMLKAETRVRVGVTKERGTITQTETAVCVFTRAYGVPKPVGSNRYCSRSGVD